MHKIRKEGDISSVQITSIASAAVLAVACGTVTASEPPLLDTRGNIAMTYTGKLVAVEEVTSIVTVHGSFLPDNDQVQAIKCKLSGFKTKGVRWYSLAERLENVFIGAPLPTEDDNDNQKVMDAIGQTVKVAPLGDTCLRFDVVEER